MNFENWTKKIGAKVDYGTEKSSTACVTKYA